MEAVKDAAKKCCTAKNIKKKVPISLWLPKYNLENLSGDVVAGITVGLTVIPQGMAYAVVAGLEPNYGLYSAFMGCFVYMIFGSCKDITIGPTAIMAIMTHEYSVPGSPEYAILLCFLSGLIIFASGLINLGFLINFISKTVISGFTSAAAITIATSQLKSLFGISYRSEGFIDTLKQLFDNISNTRWQDVTLGICCIISLLLLRKLKDVAAIKIKDDDSMGIKILKKTLFLCSVGRNAVIVIVSTIIAGCLYDSKIPDYPFRITGDVTPGLPPFELPPFSISNGTETISFSDMMSHIGIGIVIVPLISILESIAIASAFSGGKTIDANQEMIALGLCNIMGAFVQSIPTTGSFSRTAVNSSSGVKTQAGGAVTGLLVILALAFLTPYFKFIPKATLAAVIICAVIFMIEYHDIIPIWKVRRIDQLPLWITFLTCLLWKLEYGILIGAASNIFIVLYGIARPKINVTTYSKGTDNNNPEYLIVEPRSGLFFPTIDYVKSSVNKVGNKDGQGITPIVVDCKHFTGIDYSGSKGVHSLLTDFAKREQTLVFTNITPGVESGIKALSNEVCIVKNQQDISHTIQNAMNSQTVSRPSTSDQISIQRRSVSDLEAVSPLLERHTNVVIVPTSDCNS